METRSLLHKQHNVENDVCDIACIEAVNKQAQRTFKYAQAS